MMKDENRFVENKSRKEFGYYDRYRSDVFYTDKNMDDENVIIHRETESWIGCNVEDFRSIGGRRVA